MTKHFLNREQELKLLNAHTKSGGLIVILGRRRIGKTFLLKHWLDKFQSSKIQVLYTQAIESTSGIQVQQSVQDFSVNFKFVAEPKSWLEVFRLLDADRKRKIICIDEFQYLVKSDPTLPSVIQRWLDHENKSNSLLVLSGSSRKILAEACLEHDAPLFGRSKQIITLAPLKFSYLSKFLSIPINAELFRIYSLVGGIPKYWEHLKTIQILAKRKLPDIITVVEYLLFKSTAFLEGEISRLLSDEKIDGISPLGVLEAIGRGASRPSEIAARMNVPQTQLSKLFEILINAHIICRFVPFGSSYKNAKIVSYRIIDPSILSIFTLASVHKSRWNLYTDLHKNEILNTHCGHVFEQYVRESIPGSSAFWNSRVEIDLVYERNGLLEVGEVKWTSLRKGEISKVMFELERKVRENTNFLAQYSRVALNIYDQSFLTTGKPALRQIVEAKN